MFVFLLHVLVISKAFYQVSCTGILKIDFKGFDSGIERAYNRRSCCIPSSIRCKCIFQFHICITHQKTAKETCIDTTGIKTLSITKVSFDHEPLNPLHITAEEFLGEYLLDVTINSEDSVSDNSKGSLFDKMQTRFSVSMATKAGSEEKLQNLKIEGASIRSRYQRLRSFRYDVSAQCSPGFSPPDCSELACVGRDDITGHYKCGDDGEKICLDGWKNVTSNCTERNVTTLHTSILVSTSTLSVQSSSTTSSATISSRHSSKATSQYQTISKQSTSVTSLLQTTLKVSSSVTEDDFSSSTFPSSLISQHHMTSSLSLLPTPSFSRAIDIKTMSLFSNETKRLLKTILSQLPSIYTPVSSAFGRQYEPVTSKMTAAFSSAPERSVYTWSSFSDTLTNKISSKSVLRYSSITTTTSIDEFSASTSRLDTLPVTSTTVSALISTDVQRLLPSMTSIHTDILETSSSYYFVTTNKEENKITTIFTILPSQFLSETSTTLLMPTTSLMTKLSTTSSTLQQSTTSSAPKLLITSATTQLATSSLTPKPSTSSSTPKALATSLTSQMSTTSSTYLLSLTSTTNYLPTKSSKHLLPPMSTSQSHFEKYKINYILLAVASVAVILVIILAACLACQRTKIRKKLKSHQYQLQELRGVVLSNNGHLNIPLNTLNYDEDAMVRHDRNKTLMETPGSEFIGFHNEMYLKRNGLRIYDEPKDFASHPTYADTADFPEPPTDMLGDSTEYNENNDSYPTAPPITTSNTPPTMSLQDELKNTLNLKLHSPPTNLEDKSGEPIDRLDNKPPNHFYDRVGNNNCPNDTRLANRYMINSLYNVEENVFTGFRNKGFEAPE